MLGSWRAAEELLRHCPPTTLGLLCKTLRCSTTWRCHPSSDLSGRWQRDVLLGDSSDRDLLSEMGRKPPQAFLPGTVNWQSQTGIFLMGSWWDVCLEVYTGVLHIWGWPRKLVGCGAKRLRTFDWTFVFLDSLPSLWPLEGFWKMWVLW